MRKSTNRFLRILIVCCTNGSLLTGCVVTGANVFSNERLKYNEATTETNSQMLLAILHTVSS